MEAKKRTCITNSFSRVVPPENCLAFSDKPRISGWTTQKAKQMNKPDADTMEGYAVPVSQNHHSGLVQFLSAVLSLTTIECKQRREHASHIVSVEWFLQRTVSPSVINLAFLAGDRFMRLSHSLSASANVLPDRSIRVLLCVGNFMM
jgi:hypothetical protein